MKKVQLLEQQPKTIDWDKPQWVQNKYEHDSIILTRGKHYGDSFAGTAMPCGNYYNGLYSTDWLKECFQLLTTEIPFIISNED